jgi:Protein of unknown function (DUF2917)
MRRTAMPFDRPAVSITRRTFLPARETLVLENARGTIIAVEHGCLWITLERDTRDIVLTDGMRFKVNRRGRTVVAAEEDSRLRVKRPLTFHERFLRKLRDAIFRPAKPSRLMFRRAVPYY